MPEPRALDAAQPAAAPPDRRGVLGWMLFDWANQPFYTLIVTFVFAPYFVAQVVGDSVQGQAIWGAATAIAGAIVAILSPPLGAIADRTGGRKLWAFGFSILYVAGCLGIWGAAPGTAVLWPVLFWFVLAYIGSEFTTLYTNAMLPELGPRGEIGRISGSGWALGYVGGLVSLILVLALLVPAPGKATTLIGLAPLFGLDPALGEPARATGPVSAIWYVVFVIPLFLWSPDVPRTRESLGAATRAGLADLAGSIAALRRERSLGAYLLASMIYRDALAALFAFGGIYAAGVLGWGVFQLGIFGIVAAATGALGAWIGGRADRAHGPRPVITGSIWLLILVCLAVLATSRDSILGLAVPPGSRLPDLVFLVAGGLLGAAAGALQAASRTLLVHQAEGRMGMGQAFGIFALAGKATAFIGPTLIAAATAATGSQRLGVSPIVALFLIGLALLSFVKTSPEQPRKSAR